MSDTYTANFGLVKPEFDKPRYQDDINGNFDIIDALLARYIAANNVRGVWANSTLYLLNDQVVDADEGQLYKSTSEHTSSGSPTTFAAYRTANPGVWVPSSGVRALGVWQPLTSYAPGDFVTSGTIFAICTVPHTSSASFIADSAYWSYLIDVSTALVSSSVNVSGNYTFILTDAFKVVTSVDAVAQTFTIPTNASVGFTLGTQVLLRQGGAGQLSIAPDVGVTLSSPFSRRKLVAQESPAVLIKVGTDTWWLYGDITT